MKKTLALMLSLAMAASLLSGCVSSRGESDSADSSSDGTQQTSGGVVNVYNWGEYIDMSVLEDFEAATGIETRATILGHMQRGGSPTCKDRVYASMMGAMAADLLCDGKTNRVVGYQHGRFQDFDINEALNMVKGIDPYQYQVAKDLSRHCQENV